MCKMSKIMFPMYKFILRRKGAAFPITTLLFTFLWVIENDEINEDTKEKSLSLHFSLSQIKLCTPKSLMKKKNRFYFEITFLVIKNYITK